MQHWNSETTGSLAHVAGNCEGSLLKATYKWNLSQCPFDIFSGYTTIIQLSKEALSRRKVGPGQPTRQQSKGEREERRKGRGESPL